MRCALKGLMLPALVLVASAAHADADDIEWAADGSAAREVQVAPGRFVEWCGKLRRGEKVQWRFDASGPLNFNVHYHQGKDVHFPSKQDAVAKADGTLDIASDQDYCWMWTNKSATPASLKASLRRGA